MKTLLILFTLVFSFQMLGAGLSNGAYAIVWGSCPAELAANSEQALNNAMPACLSANASVTLLKADGTAISSGPKNLWTDVPPGLSNLTAVAMGDRYGLALHKDGTVGAWGDGQNDKTRVPDRATNVIAIATGEESCVAVRQDGTVIGWGENKLPVGLSNVTAVALSTLLSGHNLALRRDGTVVEWGNQTPFALHQIAGLSNVTSIAVGPANKLALKSDGTVFAWGGWNHGETDVPVGLSNVVAIAAGGFRNEGMAGAGYSLALRKDGTITAWGAMGFNNQPVMVPEGLSNVVTIAARGGYCLAVTTNRAVADKFRH